MTVQIIKLSPDSSGSYPPIQTFSGALPQGYGVIKPGVDTSAMQTHAGFVALTKDGITVTAVTGDDTAYRRWLDSVPPEPEAEPDELTQTQLAVAELAQVVEDNNTANQLAIAELAEALMGGEV